MTSKKRPTKRLSPLPLLLACIFVGLASIVQAEEPTVVANNRNNDNANNASPATTSSSSDHGANKGNYRRGPAPVHSPIAALGPSPPLMKKRKKTQKEIGRDVAKGSASASSASSSGAGNDGAVNESPKSKEGSDLSEPKPQKVNYDDITYTDPIADAIKREFKLGKYKDLPEDDNADNDSKLEDAIAAAMKNEYEWGKVFALNGNDNENDNDMNDLTHKFSQILSRHPNTPPYEIEELGREIQTQLQSGIYMPQEVHEAVRHSIRAMENVKEEEKSQPTTQPTTAAPTNNNKVYEQVYSQLFNPDMEEYDVIKFDPYSFSGAPLGGWGRATRSRLATLPIRLVSDFGGGVDLLYGTASSVSHGFDDEKEDDLTLEETMEQDENGDSGIISSQDDNDESTELKEEAATSDATTASSKNKPNLQVQPSTGPHFSIHDATGQKYICRVYAEEELIVLSRLDSVFDPAVTIWDESLVDAIDGSGGGTEQLEADDEVEDDKSEHGMKKKFQFSINSSKFENAEGLPEGIRSSVAKMLRKMGMDDAAEALNRDEHHLQDIANDPEAYGFNNGNDIHIHVADADGNFNMDGVDGGADLAGILNGAAVDGGADPNMADLAKIIKAAAVGAKMQSNTQDENDSNNSVDEKKPATPSAPPLQLTPKQVHRLLHKLTDECSQLHLGWWSYEWCHEEQFRQFHIAMSESPTSKPRYDIQDVTLVGKYNRADEIYIAYPGGVYDGVTRKGETMSVKFDKWGREMSLTSREHGLEEDLLLGKSQQFSLDSESGDKKKKKKKEHHQQHKLGRYDRGPIVTQIFSSGGFCEEAGYDRNMQVELRCCTEDEIDYWLDSRNPNNKKDPNKKKKKETPQAALVSVKEEKTCMYRSRVCTPLLCPKQPVVVPEKTFSNTKLKTEKDKTQDPIGTLLYAIFGDDMAELGQVQVYFPDDITGQEFEELILQAEGGMDFTNSALFRRVKKALRKARGSSSNPLKKSQTFDVKDLLSDTEVGNGNAGSGTSSVMEVKDGESIREILDKTLGNRPCLRKNLGWWTYEFCHGEQIQQYHASSLIDVTTGSAKQKIETQHTLGVYKNSGNDASDYPNADEYLHVVNATGSSADWGKRKGTTSNAPAQNSGSKKAGGNGAVYEQEYRHGDVCDHEDVAESVIKGGNIVHGSVERATTVRFSCGKRWELIDANEDSTCHYVLDVTVPELCQHMLFKAAVTKTQVVKCLPV